MIHKTGQKIIQNNFPGESDRCENNFIHLDYQDNTFKVSCRVSKQIIAFPTI